MLEELGLEYEIIPTGWMNGETREPSFLAINPNGKIPALVDGDLVVWESLAINHYLARRYGTSGAPTTDSEAGLAYRWSFWSMSEFEGPIDAAAKHDARLPEDWAAAALNVLEDALAARLWLLGDSFGVADVNVAVMFQRPELARVDRRPFANVHDWLKRCRARPAFARMAEKAQAAAS